MTLASRVSAFFLAALAAVLIAFSATFYGLRANDLERQTEERLNGALATLAVAIEIREEAVEWEPQRKSLFVGGSTREEALPWCVREPNGQILSRSRPRFSDQFFQRVATSFVTSPAGQSVSRDIDWMSQPWRVQQRLFRPGVGDPSQAVEHSPLVPKQPLPDVHETLRTVIEPRLAPTTPGTTPAKSGSQSEPEEEDAEAGGLFPELLVQAAVPLKPMRDELHQLSLTLASMSIGAWLLAALIGHSVCRHALRPVSGMAAAANAIDVDQHQQRLPVANTHDELEDLSLSFNALLDRLHESFERQRRFTGNASHQLRTPLTVMIGQLEVALRRDRTADDYRQTLIIVQRQADQLRHIVELMLFLARADAEAQRPDLQRLDLADWLQAHRAHWQHETRIADLRIELPPDTTLSIHAQPALLAQVVDNLVENAMAYSPAGSAVRLNAGCDTTHVWLSVADEGCGIPATELSQLFRPFYRSEKARSLRPQGTGLGLAVAHRIVTVLGGQVSAEPNSPRGTTFTIRFPQANA